MERLGRIFRDGDWLLRMRACSLCVCVGVLVYDPPMRWEIDAHVCVRVCMYADIPCFYSVSDLLPRQYAGLPTCEELHEAFETDYRRPTPSFHELHKVHDR